MSHKSGKTFGLGYDAYVKVYMPKSLVSIEFAKKLPPVGKYDIMKEPGENAPKYTLKAKGRNLEPVNIGEPTATTYSPNTVL